MPIDIRRWLAAALLLLATGSAFADNLQSLRNMERERADLIQTFRSSDMTPVQREAHAAADERRLVDLERIVLRDDRLLGDSNPLVRLTFRNYDLSFLIDASAEKHQLPVEHWLTSMGISSASIEDAIPGRRP